MTEASAQYVQRLDLGEDPFSADFVGDYFYSGASRRQLLDQVAHLSRFGDHVVVLVGSAGSGKSRLLDATFDRLQALMDCCHINAEMVSTPEGLLETLAEQLRLHLDAPVSKSDFLLALETCSGDTTQSEPVLIAIDQAQFLELESYEWLLDLFNRAQGLIRLLIIGEYQVEQLAQLAGFVGGRTKILEIEPLTISEIDDYLMGLLASVGYAGNQPLDSDQLAVLREQSQGQIGEINKLMPSLLNDGASQPPKSFEFAIPTAHLSAVAILLTALVISYFYHGADEVGEQPNDLKEVAARPKPSQKTIPIENPITAQSKKTSEQVSVDKPKLTSAPTPRFTQVKSVQSQADDELTMPSVKAPPAPSLVLVREKTNRKSPTDKAIDEPIAKDELIAKDKPAAKDKSVAKKVEVVARSEPEPATKYPVAEPARKDEAKPAIAKEAKTPKKMVASKKTKPTAASGSPRERRVMDLPVSSYMLQLLGSVEEKRSREFVKRYVGRLSITYVEVRRKGKPWFIVLSGPFDDRAAALKAIGNLPDTLQRQKPWARSVAGIQKDIQSK
jgi:DamX protein